jgi:hypothetical protein
VLAHLGEASADGVGIREQSVLSVVAPDADAWVSDARLPGDGHLVALLMPRGGPPVVALGPLSGPFATRPAPPGAITLEAADARHLVAASDTEHVLAAGPAAPALWSSDDAGRTWQPVALPRGVDSSALATRRYGPVALRCADGLCALGPRLTLLSPALRGALPDASFPPLLAAGVAPAPFERDFDQEYIRGVAGLHQQELACTFVPAVPEEAAEPDDATIPGTDGWLQWRRRGRPGPPAADVSVRWGGVDERGVFAVRRRTFALPARAPAPRPSLLGLSAQPEPEQVGPVLLTRAFALIERCSTPHLGCDLIFVPREGAARALGDFDRWLHDGARGAYVRGALATPEGGAALLLTLEHQRNTESLADVLLQLDAHGREVAQRAFSWGQLELENREHPPAPERMLALGAAGPELVMYAIEAPRTWSHYGLDPRDGGRLLAALPPRAPGACSDARDPRATRVELIGTPWDADVRFALRRGERAEGTNFQPLTRLELSDRGACVREIAFLPPHGGDVIRLWIPGVPRLRAAHDALVGASVARGRAYPLRCERPAPPADAQR